MKVKVMIGGQLLNGDDGGLRWVAVKWTDEGGYAVGRAVLADGEEHALKAGYQGQRNAFATKDAARRAVFEGFRRENAAILLTARNPRPEKSGFCGKKKFSHAGCCK